MKKGVGEIKRKEAVINSTTTANSKQQQKQILKYILKEQYAMQSHECTDEIKTQVLHFTEKNMLKFKKLMNTSLRKITSSERLCY